MITKAWEEKEEFKARVQEWAKKLDVQVQTVSVRPMTNKWASCSTNGRLNFNDELLKLDLEIGDYVIVHELLHFHIPNHGKLWKSLMHLYLGDYAKLERRLPQLAAQG